jgi:hypothetical protein
MCAWTADRDAALCSSSRLHIRTWFGGWCFVVISFLYFSSPMFEAVGVRATRPNLGRRFGTTGWILTTLEASLIFFSRRNPGRALRQKRIQEKLRVGPDGRCTVLRELRLGGLERCGGQGHRRVESVRVVTWQESQYYWGRVSQLC